MCNKRCYTEVMNNKTVKNLQLHIKILFLTKYLKITNVIRMQFLSYPLSLPQFCHTKQNVISKNKELIQRINVN